MERIKPLSRDEAREDVRKYFDDVGSPANAYAMK